MNERDTVSPGETDEQAAPGDTKCQRCQATNIVWFTPDNDLWNRVSDAAGAGVLCVTCFVRAAEDILGVEPSAWMVSPEPRAESEGAWVWLASEPTTSAPAAECICELLDFTTLSEIRFVRGFSRGCRLHPPSEAEKRELRYEAEILAAQKRAREAP